jgi:hypothetical protein
LFEFCHCTTPSTGITKQALPNNASKQKWKKFLAEKENKTMISMNVKQAPVRSGIQ